jgi:hypothetical protein
VDSCPDAAALMEIPVAVNLDKAYARADASGLETVSSALEGLGFPMREARARTEQAWREVVKNGQAPEEELLLAQALRSAV